MGRHTLNQRLDRVGSNGALDVQSHRSTVRTIIPSLLSAFSPDSTSTDGHALGLLGVSR